MTVVTTPGWALGVAIAVVIISVVRGGVRASVGGLSRWGRYQRQDDLERRLADLEQAQGQLGAGDAAQLEQRVAELEERLDFAERMLAKQRDSERLGPPPHV